MIHKKNRVNVLAAIKPKASSSFAPVIINEDKACDLLTELYKMQDTVVRTINNAIGNHFLDKLKPRMEIGSLFFL